MKTLLIPALVLFAFLPNAQAQGLSYSYIEGGVGTHDLEGTTTSGDLVGFGISIGLGDSLFLTARSNTSTFDLGIGGDLDLARTAVGLGFHTSIGDATDLVLRAELINMEIELGGTATDDDGIAFCGGLRMGLSDSFELSIGYSQVEYDSADSDTMVDAGARWNITANLSLGVNIESWDDSGEDLVMGSLRFYL